MNILNKIIEIKKLEIDKLKKSKSISQLENEPQFTRKSISLRNAISNKSSSGIIAEFKRKSPSKGIINNFSSIESVCLGYEKAGAAALSILTDSTYFGAKSTDFSAARKLANIPILRKEFILDEYQIIESKAIGADAILLIKKILTDSQIKHFTQLAHQLGLEVFLELENEIEIYSTQKIDVDILGINNRNLDQFTIQSQKSLALCALLDSNKIKVSESGISSSIAVKKLKEVGFSGFLIGSHFMESEDPGTKCSEFINALKQ